MTYPTDTADVWEHTTRMRYYVGWDAGAWHCDQNVKSRDALVVFTDDGNDALTLVRTPFWGNVREHLWPGTGLALVTALLKCCGVPAAEVDHIIIAIDTPLGWPAAAVGLLAQGNTVAVPPTSQADPYLFRATERLLFAHGHRPLSVVRDMISSQSLKGIHTRQQLGGSREQLGVWTLRESGVQVDLIETYPAPYTRLKAGRDEQLDGLTAALITTLHGAARRQDTADACFCAWLAARFALAREDLLPPNDSTPPDEGWIWLPRAVYTSSTAVEPV